MVRKVLFYSRKEVPDFGKLLRAIHDRRACLYRRRAAHDALDHIFPAEYAIGRRDRHPRGGSYLRDPLQRYRSHPGTADAGVTAVQQRAARLNVHVERGETVYHRKAGRARFFAASRDVDDADGFAGEFYEDGDFNGVTDDACDLCRRLRRVAELLAALVAEVFGMRAAKVELEHRQAEVFHAFRQLDPAFL
ncbi:hypothetical protein SDC9_184199 [bioreactor metagenome]|uniref:Uncharacterized protein n=1 Tax=bioreactor metagenome TaxID=1076179 RepID=A0A645HEX6_9ZZZZ